MNRPTEKFSAKPIVLTPSAGVNKKGSVSVNLRSIKRRPTLALGLARLLISEYYDYVDLSRDDTLMLNESVLALSEVRDPSFKEKYGSLVLTLMFLISVLNSERTVQEAKRKVSLAKVNLSQVYLTSRQIASYQTTFSNIRKEYSFRLEFLRTHKLPLKRYIGVGYKDQGNAKIPEYDGSPSWQEVASASGAILAKNSKAKTQNPLRRKLLSHNTIHDESRKAFRLIHRRLVQELGLRS